MTPDTRPLIIYHADCNDGLTAAWAIKRAFAAKHQDVELFPAKYQTPPNVNKRFVIIADFSYKRPVLQEMLETAYRIEIYDHHKSAQADLEGLAHPKLRVVFDMERSGAGIAWDEFHGEEPRPWFVNYVEDNDLWRHKLDNCKAVLEYIRSYPAMQHFAMYDEWMNGHNPQEVPLGILVEGDAILRAKKVLVEQSLTFHHEEELLIGDGPHQGPLKVLVANVPFFLSSEVAGALAEMNRDHQDIPVGITYYQREDGRWSLSFRSIGDFDVSKLALSFGGGGHRNAAGATVNDLPWALPLYKLESKDEGKTWTTARVE